jgi:uncharacterized damage-inducible protein DinB
VADDLRDASPDIQLMEAWHTNNRIHVMLIDGISDEGLAATLSTRGGRDVARQFAHIHNVRRYALDTRAKDLVGDLVKFESKYSPTRDELKEALEASCEAVGTFLTDVQAGRPKRRGMRKGLFTHFAYFIAHESHHRGGIMLTLKQTGHMPNKDIAYGIWGWDQR